VFYLGTFVDATPHLRRLARVPGERGFRVDMDVPPAIFGCLNKANGMGDFVLEAIRLALLLAATAL